MLKRSYYKVSEIQDFARYGDSIFSSKYLLALLHRVFLLRRIYKSVNSTESTESTESTNTSNSAESADLAVVFNIISKLKKHSSTLEIVGSLIGLTILITYWS